MNEAVLALLAGLLIGAAIVLLVVTLRRRHESEGLEQLKAAFAALSREALSGNAEDFLTLAKTRLERQTVEGEQHLDEKKKLIDARLSEMAKTLGDLNKQIQSVERHRAESHGALKGQLEKATQATNRLHETTAQLREALANPQRRGQWGERMAEDVLRLAGFIEGVNYTKQQQLADGTRPDFTFPLPGDRRVHMDVKFPLANYLKVLDATDDVNRQACTSQFLKDVRQRVKEVTTRSYIDPAAGTVDYVLVFIPNEQVYGFIHEHDHNLLDDAMRQKVVLCSPLTLYAILAVIRQSVDNFHLEQGARQILDLLAAFNKHWGKYVESMETLGRRLDAARKDYDELVGVRTRQLDRQLDKIDDLRAAREEQVTGSLPSATPEALPAGDQVE